MVAETVGDKYEFYDQKSLNHYLLFIGTAFLKSPQPLPRCSTGLLKQLSLGNGQLKCTFSYLPFYFLVSQVVLWLEIDVEK